jgi:tetratricopeptide (TPR) repeat protein
MAVSVEQAFAMAMQNHQAGNLQQAELLYKQVLVALPEHLDANHNLGVLYQQVARYDLALPLLQKTLALHPKFAEAHYNLSLALANLNRTEEALVHAQRALKLKPEYPEGESNLGNIHRVLGNWGAATKHYKKALALNPRFFQAYEHLGSALRAQEKFEQAIEQYQKALRINPNYVDALNNLGLTLTDSGRPGEAIEQYKKALALSPDNAHIHNNLGVAFAALADFAVATTHYAKALELHPDYAQAHANLGLALRELGQPLEALRHFLECVRLAPDFAGGHNSLGVVQQSLGSTREAEISYRKALALHSDYPQAHNNLGNLLKGLGQLEEAATHYRRAIALKPDYAEAHRHLADTKRHCDYDDDIKAMEKLYDDPGASDAQRTHAGFGLGKAYEDLGQFDRAFQFFQTANRLHRGSFEFSIAREEEFFQQLVATFDQHWANIAPLDYDPGTTPVFIIGMPRSGTSLTEQILASHSRVYGAGELTHLWTLAHNAVSGKAFPEGIEQLSNADFNKMGEAYINLLRQNTTDCTDITDKAPINFLYVGLIKRILPQAMIIHCQRNALDTCFSIYKTCFSSAQLFAYDLGELGAYYRLYQKLMSHWESIYPGGIFPVNYEELVAEPEPSIRRLLDYCQLPFEPACLTPHRTQREVRTASATQVRQPIYRGSVQHWAHYEKHLAPLKLALGIS